MRTSFPLSASSSSSSSRPALRNSYTLQVAIGVALLAGCNSSPANNTAADAAAKTAKSPKPAVAKAEPIATKPAAAPASAAPVAAGPADAAARKAITDLVPQARIDKVEPAPLPGYRQVIVGGQMVYVSNDGKYLLQGTLYDAAAKRDLTASRLAEDSKVKVDAVPNDKRIIFAADGGEPKYKVTVFTDLDCGYCRKLHSQIAEYNKRGIEVDYLFFPRSGIGSPSYDKAVSVWCAKDRKTAFTAAKAGQNPPALKCDNPVADEFKLGTEVGVDGTPTVFAPDGSKIGGYIPPDEMLKKLETLGTAKLAGT